MAVVNVELSALPPFDPRGDVTSIGPRWKKWRKAFGYFIVGKGIVNDAQKKALLLHCAGMDEQEVFDTLPEPPAENVDGDDEATPTEYEVAMRKLDCYFLPKINEPFERHMFRGLFQEEEETVDQFLTRLRRQSDNCGWDNPDAAIRDQVIDTCMSVLLRRKLLERGTDLTLSRVQDIARTLEAVEIQVRKMGGEQHGSSGVNRIGGKNQASSKTMPQKKGRCYRCDREGHYSGDKNCPARDQTCNECQRVGHFAVVCKTRNERSPENEFRDGNAKPRGGYKHKYKGRVQAVDGYESGDDYAFTVKDADKEGQVRIDVAVGGIPLRMLIDSGAVTNIVDRDTWETLKSSRIMCHSYKCDRKLYAYGSSNPIPVLGCFTAKVKLTHSDEREGEFIVIDGRGQPLLGRETAMALGVLKLGINSIRESMIDEFPECFKGTGKIHDYKVKSRMKEDVKPILQDVMSEKGVSVKHENYEPGKDNIADALSKLRAGRMKTENEASDNEESELKFKLANSEDDRASSDQKLRKTIVELDNEKRERYDRCNELTDQIVDLEGVELKLKRKLRGLEGREASYTSRIIELEQLESSAQLRIVELEGVNENLSVRLRSVDDGRSSLVYELSNPKTSRDKQRGEIDGMQMTIGELIESLGDSERQRRNVEARPDEKNVAKGRLTAELREARSRERQVFKGGGGSDEPTRLPQTNSPGRRGRKHVRM